MTFSCCPFTEYSFVDVCCVKSFTFWQQMIDIYYRSAMTRPLNLYHSVENTMIIAGTRSFNATDLLSRMRLNLILLSQNKYLGFGSAVKWVTYLTSSQTPVGTISPEDNWILGCFAKNKSAVQYRACSERLRCWPIHCHKVDTESSASASAFERGCLVTILC